ncbi:DUF2975 domain-containing protein [Streptococcus caprae]|uniref:DUF2975 domain-containing protein n=1 Tax=Streptococcus caprae TaxID=1640501 RepID=A0ABV8CVS9_9STRE
MKTNKLSYLKYGVWFTNFMMALDILALILSVIFAAAIQFGWWNRLIEMASESDPNFTITTAGGGVPSVWFILLDMLAIGVVLAILYCIRRFFKNLIVDRIFVADNVKLIRWVAIFLAISSFVGSGNYAFDARYVIDVTYLFAALVVWVISKVFERANEIAEENEFTV